MNHRPIRNFLILEDNPADALVCKYTIANKFHDADITICESLSCAKKILRQQSFDCILADLGLQDAQGETIIKEVLRLAPTSVVVVITGTRDDEAAIMALKAGAGDYVEKMELNANTLYKSIIYSIERKASSEELRASEEKFRSVVTSASDTILTIDLEHRLMFINKPDGLFYRTCHQCDIFDIIPESTHPKIKATFKKVLDKNKPSQVSLVLHEDLPEEQWFSVNIGPFISHGEMNGYVLVSRDITEQKMVEMQIYNLNLQLREFSTHLEKVREDERMHISREIHDELGQQLTSIKFLFAQLLKMCSEQNDKAKDLISQGTEIITNTIKTVRRIATDLRPGMIEDLGLEAALEWQIQEFSQRTGIKCTRKIKNISDQYPTYINNVIFRLLQESLTNITKHAEATKAEISIIEDKEKHIKIYIKDNGKGLDITQIRSKGKLGITGMMERVAHLQGVFDIQGQPRQGTEINITLPIPQ